MLLDSNVVWWWLTQPEALSGEVLTALASQHRRLFVSVATVWELEIKQASGKLDLTPDFWPFVETAVDEILDIRWSDALAAARLPLYHRDPFDRMIIGQALSRGLTVASRDAGFSAYGVPIIAA